MLRTLDFETAADPFVGSGCVAYLLKSMGKRVVASDFLNFPSVVATATLADSHLTWTAPPSGGCGPRAKMGRIS
jgi:adenine-specific DNA-methyltransferase